MKKYVFTLLMGGKWNDLLMMFRDAFPILKCEYSTQPEY